ncbi:Cytochrome bd-II ubiquinol oxidase subunit 1 [Arthrobacter saudimassiliensis]|uniref:Cytochrome bd-II ubiquinol oxidase subunit 1 n=1 Tax=Arthrobacter saudimassiliensis TaxID=1461584 RepID=A0A078MNN2_9MICC|nr:Cytochrome bd-II ubiquinol oxidase subunit 1 [Arthrobacter saudimassiliensis]
MDALDIARWQFGITTVYHFLMVPLTIGLGLVVATLQTVWVRTGKDVYLRMTKFWGKLFLINFILGIATGLVQEFQFGLAWSEYSRFVGDVFGAPLALESLLAFFTESVFLGLWIFGWKRLPKKIHLATIWAAVLASVVSAYFILAANSWMQHPVGTEIVDGRARLTDIWAVLTNNTLLVAFPHTITGALAVAGGFLLGIAWYHLWKRRKDGIDTVDASGRVVVGEVPGTGRDKADHRVWFRSLRIGAWIAVIAFAGVAVTGDLQAKLMFEQQPMKMAAAESACHDGTGFSVLAVGDVGSTDCNDVTNLIEVPGLLSFLANGDFNTEVKGVNTLIPEYQEAYGEFLPEGEMYGDYSGAPVNYVPDLAATYWAFRIMIGFGAIAAAAAAAALWVTRKGTVPQSKWLMRLAVFGILAPFGANAAGWVFTELGRQPFVVAPNPAALAFGGNDGVFMFTAAAVSPGVELSELLFSVIAFTLVYFALLVVEVRLLVKFVRGGVPSSMPGLLHGGDDGPSGGLDSAGGDEPENGRKKADDVLDFAY